MAVKRDTTQEHVDGPKEVFSTGAKRSKPKELPRYDLIPPDALRRLALRFALGAEAYGAHNWELGFPLSNGLDHFMEHLHKWRMGLEPEDDHLGAMMWFIAVAMYLEHTEHNDLHWPTT